jgi:uncharacterized protein (DUF1800 family)
MFYGCELRSSDHFELKRSVYLFSLVATSILFVLGCGQSAKETSKTSEPPPSLTISGPSLVRLGSTAQFTVTASGLANDSVSWSIGSASGGSSSLGTISAGGLYSAPPATGSLGSLVINAQSISNPSLTATYRVSLINPIPVLTLGSLSPSGTALMTSLTIQGSGFVPGATIELGAENVTPTAVSPTSISANISTLQLQVSALSVQVTNPNPGSATSTPILVPVSQQRASITQAARLLDQATFGPTFADIQHVQSIGIQAYLAEQLAEPPSIMPGTSWLYGAINPGCQPFATCEPDGHWTQFALFSPDQMRQRVALALSKLWTVSYNEVPAQYFPYLLNVFSQDAFANWRQVMQDVTFSPAMGIFLNSVNNLVQSLTDRANENYAREFLQIFSTGTSLLNEDGTLQLDVNGNPIPAYTQDQVIDLSRALTGFTLAKDDCSAPSAPQPVTTSGYMADTMCPMAVLDQYHDHGEKHLLDGTDLPAGQSASKDISDAIDNVFNNPNTPPFVVKNLIQNLIESNPSPSYVERVVHVFKDNGKGVRGDMAAVYSAIYLDPEARAGDDPSTANPTGGHLRDPILWTTAVLRSLNPTVTPSVNGDVSAYRWPDYLFNQFNEQLHNAPDVFGFYSPTYVIPGSNVVGPEFQLEIPGTLYNEFFDLSGKILPNQLGASTTGAQMNVDLSSTSALGTLAAQGVEPLLDGIRVLYFHGQMSADVRSIFEQALQGMKPDQMVRVAVYLATTSPQFKVIQ